MGSGVGLFAPRRGWGVGPLALSWARPATYDGRAALFVALDRAGGVGLVGLAWGPAEGGRVFVAL